MLTTLLLAAALQIAPPAQPEADRDIACAAFAAWLDDYRQRFEHAGPSLVLVSEPNLSSGNGSLPEDVSASDAADNSATFREVLPPADAARVWHLLEPAWVQIDQAPDSDRETADTLLAEALARAYQELDFRPPQRVVLSLEDWAGDARQVHGRLAPHCSESELGGPGDVRLIDHRSEAEMSREEFAAWQGGGYSEVMPASRRSQTGEGNAGSANAGERSYWAEVYTLQAVRLDTARHQVLLDVEISSHGSFRYWLRRSDEGGWIVYASQDLIWY